jgi:membrane protease YdiL (CAAX protease family)
VFAIAYSAVAAAWPPAAQAMRGAAGLWPSISLSAVIAVSAINPLFEEIFVCGYVITALKDRPDPWTGIHVSVAIRLLYHLYQGAISAVGIVPFGLIFGFWYARTGRLWPVIVAHAIWDFVGLIQYMR